jgi:hypothetical protein
VSSGALTLSRVFLSQRTFNDPIGPEGVRSARQVVMTNPGDWLHGLREELHLTRVAVERFTSGAASRANNERYRIRRGRLTQIEEGKAVPDIFEVESLRKCYKVTYEAVLHVFGTRLEKSQDTPQGSTKSDETARPRSFTDMDRPFSPTFQSKISFDTTRLVTERAEELGVPAIVRQRLDAGQFRLGIIALDDDPWTVWSRAAPW